MNNENPELEFISTSTPNNDSDQASHESDKPILTNAFGTGKASQSVSVDPAIILEEIVESTSGWPKCAAGQLIVKSASGAVRSIKNDTEFFAWLHEHFNVMWRSSPGVPKSEFFEFCRNNAEQFDDVSKHPHFPPLDRILYDHPEPLYVDGEALNEFLNFFSPSTAEDRELIKAFLLTLFWGGKPGQRPAFLITTDGSGPHKGVGAGKTTLVEKCSELCGGSFSTSTNESIERLKTRILSQENKDSCPRVIELDNVKTRRFSSAELESLITNRQISGHEMFRGNGSVPNLHTVVITINGASLSKDLAQRCIVIILADAEKSQTWAQDLDDFIENHRWAIIGDIGQLLESEVHPLPNEGSTRWAAWEYGVLSRVDTPETVRTLIQARQGMLDDDDANGDEFIKHIQENLGRFKIYPNSVAKILHDEMHILLKEFLGESIGKNVVTKKIDAMGLQCLHRISKPGKPRVWLFRRDGWPLTPDQISAAMSPPSD